MVAWRELVQWMLTTNAPPTSPVTMAGSQALYAHKKGHNPVIFFVAICHRQSTIEWQCLQQPFYSKIRSTSQVYSKLLIFFYLNSWKAEKTYNKYVYLVQVTLKTLLMYFCCFFLHQTDLPKLIFSSFFSLESPHQTLMNNIASSLILYITRKQ